ncbi:DUF6452 family protein [Cellulophaga baltica]|uniref:DUF1735 domain-containing protein n=1 Tax=Cellulophaga baltica TaxID=76594 RepID=A0A1G7IK76_9FLAO|nr:DUF6452 family protein [Cellulophaga baltica]AIY13556.1 hypothetical protein M667_10260 [Cellulophaga baltica NN016038]SDF12936.1 hypothetical protein SAMN04487992_107292 [Cellulophaga baltica]
MSTLKYILALAVMVFAFNSCEKDDICVDGDTPLLVIRFYDATITTDLKAPSNLQVKGLLDTGEYGDIITNTSTDSIQIPLRIDGLSTTYNLSINATTDAENANEDVLVFDYATKEVFISRACGYVVNYEELSDELTTDTDNWIKNIEITNTTVEDQTTAHVKIFH